MGKVMPLLALPLALALLLAFAAYDQPLVSAASTSVSIDYVHDGTQFVPYVDGMVVNTDTPRFRGSSTGYDSVTLQVRDSEGIVKQIGKGTGVNPDGTFQRGRTVLADDTYTIVVGSVSLGTITVNTAPQQQASSPQMTVSIDYVHDGTQFVPYVDGMVVNTDTPRFRGSSTGYDSVTLQVRDSEGIVKQIGKGTGVNPDGTFQRGRTVLADDTYTIVVGPVSLGTITVDANGGGNVQRAPSYSFAPDQGPSGGATGQVDTIHTITAISDVTVSRGETSTVRVTASDPDGATIMLSIASAQHVQNDRNDKSVTISVPRDLSFVSLADNGDGTGTITINPIFISHVGVYDVTVTATVVNSAAVQEQFRITVSDAAPTIEAIQDIEEFVGSSSTQQVSAADADGDTIALSISGNPSFVTLADNGDGTGTITVSPTDSSHIGAYDVTVTARANFLEADTDFVIAVNGRAPTIEALPDITTFRGETVTRQVSAADADGDTIALSISGNPSFVTLADNGDGTGTITVSPAALSDLGTHSATVTATAGSATGSTILSITVSDRAPVVQVSDFTESFAGPAGVNSTRQVTAADADGDTIALSISGNPSFVTLADNGDGTGTIKVETTNSTHVGAHHMTVTATANSVQTVADLVISLSDTYSKDLYLDADNANPTGIWSDKTTVWVADNEDEKAYAYSYADGTRDASKDIAFDPANDASMGVWGNGTVIWVADLADAKLFAYMTANGQRAQAGDIELHANNTSPKGVWSDGTTLWVTDTKDAKAYAYTLASGQRAPASDISLGIRASGLAGVLSGDDTIVWAGDYTGSKLLAYNVTAGGQRAPASDIAMHDGHATLLKQWGANMPEGLWSDGTLMWVVDYVPYPRVYAYDMPTDSP